MENSILSCVFGGVLKSKVVLRRGVALFEVGDRIDHVLFPITCVVSALTCMSDGRSAGVAIVGRDGAIGLPLVLGGERAIFRYVVQVGGHAVRVPARQFAEAMGAAPIVERACLRYAESFLIQVAQHAACNALHPAEARLAHSLLTICDRVDTDILDITHETLAATLGVLRPTVTLAIRRLESRRIIHARRGQLRILARPELEATACECYGAVRTAGEQTAKVSQLPAAFEPLPTSLSA